MRRVGRTELRPILTIHWGFSDKEVDVIEDYTNKHGKYDDGKFLVIKENEGYAFELS